MHDEKEIKAYLQTIFDKIRIASAVAVIRTLPDGESPKSYAEKLHNIFNTSWQNDDTSNPIRRKIVAEERDKIVKRLCETFSIGDSSLRDVEAGKRMANDNEDDSLTDSDSSIMDDLLLELNVHRHSRSIDHRGKDAIGKCQRCKNRIKIIKNQPGSNLTISKSPSSLDEYKSDLSFIQAIVWLKSAITMMRQVPVSSIKKALGKHWKTVNQAQTENFISVNKKSAKKGFDNLINDNQEKQSFFYTFDDEDSLNVDDQISFPTQTSVDLLNNADDNLVIYSDPESGKNDCANNVENDTDDEETYFQCSPGNEAMNNFLNIRKPRIGTDNEFLESTTSPDMSFGEERKEEEIVSATNVEDSGFQTLNVNSVTQTIDLKMSELSMGLRKDFFLSSIQFGDNEKLTNIGKDRNDAGRISRIQKVQNFLTIQRPSEFVTALGSSSKIINRKIGSESIGCQDSGIGGAGNVNRMITVSNSEKYNKRKKGNHSKSKGSPSLKKSKRIHQKISSVSLNHVLRTSNTNDMLLECTKTILRVFENETIVTGYSRHQKWRDSMEKEAAETVVNLVDLLQDENGPKSCKNEIVQLIKRIFERILNSESKITTSEHHITIILEFCNSFATCREILDYLIMKSRDLTDVVSTRMDEDPNLAETLKTLERSCLLFHGIETVLRKYKRMAPEFPTNKSLNDTGIPAVTELWKKRWGSNKISQNTIRNKDTNLEELWMGILEKLAVVSAENYPQITVLVWQCISILRSEH